MIDPVVAADATDARGGHDVVTDGAVGPWFLAPIRSPVAGGLRVAYVVLRPHSTRASGARELEDVGAIVGLRGAFANLGPLEGTPSPPAPSASRPAPRPSAPRPHRRRSP